MPGGAPGPRGAGHPSETSSKGSGPARPRAPAARAAAGRSLADNFAQRPRGVRSRFHPGRRLRKQERSRGRGSRSAAARGRGRGGRGPGGALASGRGHVLSLRWSPASHGSSCSWRPMGPQGPRRRQARGAGVVGSRAGAAGEAHQQAESRLGAPPAALPPPREAALPQQERTSANSSECRVKCRSLTLGVHAAHTGARGARWIRGQQRPGLPNSPLLTRSRAWTALGSGKDVPLLPWPPTPPPAPRCSSWTPTPPPAPHFSPGTPTPPPGPHCSSWTPASPPGPPLLPLAPTYPPGPPLLSLAPTAPPGPPLFLLNPHFFPWPPTPPPGPPLLPLGPPLLSHPPTPPPGPPLLPLALEPERGEPFHWGALSLCGALMGPLTSAPHPHRSPGGLTWSHGFWGKRGPEGVCLAHPSCGGRRAYLPLPGPLPSSHTGDPGAQPWKI